MVIDLQSPQIDRAALDHRLKIESMIQHAALDLLRGKNPEATGTDPLAYLRGAPRAAADAIIDGYRLSRQMSAGSELTREQALQEITDRSA